MAGKRAAQLRIHCTCGQKMRVSPRMYGRPGKCVKCRQKLRIPFADELPPGVTDLHLKDHPEFLRVVKHRHRHQQEVELEADDVSLDTQNEAPLDSLEPLRLLCSLERKAALRLEALDRVEDERRADPKRAVLFEYQSRISAARGVLDEEIRQRLMEVAVELASMRDKFDQANLAVRIGELGFEEFRGQVERLRRRRDCLERRQSNLRAWLAVHDPYVAGGFIDGDLDQIPRGPFYVVLAPEPPEHQALADLHIEELRRALARREMAEHKLGEGRRFRGDEVTAEGEDYRAECEGERARASAAVAYCRKRLEQLKADYGEDLGALDSALNLARGRLQVGEINALQFSKLESVLNRSKTDLMKAIDLIARALSANTAQDAPHPAGTYLVRLAHPAGSGRVPLDTWVAWGASLAVVLCLFLPAIAGVSPLGVFRQFGSERPIVHWIVFGPILAALLLAGVACIPRRGLRGMLEFCVALGACVAGVAFFHEVSLDVGALGDLLRQGRHWALQPGVVLFLAALLSAAGASSLALLPVRGAWVAMPLLGALALLGIVGALTDWAGRWTPSPVVAVSIDEPGEQAEEGNRVTVTVRNNGRRGLLLSSNPEAEPSSARKPNSYVLAVQRRSEEEAWEELIVPREIRVGDVRRRPGLAELPDLPVAPGERAVLNFRLDDGVYRILMDGVAVAQFEAPSAEVAEARKRAEAERQREAEKQKERETSPAVAEGVMPRGVSVELRGIVAAPEREPQFSLDVYVPLEQPRQRSLAIGGVVYGKWEIKAYDPDAQTVTVTDGDRILVLRRGERVGLDKDAAPAETGPAPPPPPFAPLDGAR